VEAKLILSILFEAKVFMFYVPPGAEQWLDINACKREGPLTNAGFRVKVIIKIRYRPLHF
jgi:hypothetical protein